MKASGRLSEFRSISVASDAFCSLFCAIGLAPEVRDDEFPGSFMPRSRLCVLGGGEGDRRVSGIFVSLICRLRGILIVGFECVKIPQENDSPRHFLVCGV